MWLVRKNENLIAICEPCGPLQPVAGLALHFFSLLVQVYSVVHGVVSLELIRQSISSSQQVNINHWLIEKGYAQRADESYLSKVSVQE